jgi:hypothetical protein
VGLALTSAFLSSVFFSSSFLSSFAGLAVGLAVVDGLEVAAGEAATTGVDAGVEFTGLFGALVSVQAAENAAIAAKTVNRIDLLIVFPWFYRSPERLSEVAATESLAASAGFAYTARCKSFGVRSAFLQHCDR